MYTNLAGVDDLGCAMITTPNGRPRQVMQIDPVTGLPVWGPGGAGGPTTVVTAFAAGVLTVTVNGVSANVNLRGQLFEDAFNIPLGYLLSL